MPLIENFSTSIFVEGPLYTKVLYVNPISLDSSLDHGLYAAYRAQYKGFAKASSAYAFKDVGDYALWSDKDALLPEGVTILTLVTKKTGRSIPSLEGVEQSIQYLWDILHKEYEKDERPIVITPLLGCGLGQLVYYDASPIMDKIFKNYDPFVIVSIHPMNRPDEPTPQITILTDGEPVNYTDRDLLKRLKALNHKQEKLRVYVPSYEKKLVKHLQEHFDKELGIDMWVVDVEDQNTLLTREPPVPLLGSNGLAILRQGKSKASVTIVGQATKHMDRIQTKIYYFTQ